MSIDSSSNARADFHSQVFVSVVIPTWNEEQWLPMLLDSLIVCPEVKEIIIADNYSTDRTVSIAQKYGCKIVAGGTPSQGRNAGARVAHERVIVFLDADVAITPQILPRLLRHLASSNVAGVHFKVKPMSNKRFAWLCYVTMDYYFLALKKIGLSQGIGSIIGVSRDAFLHVNGFREDVAVGEDADFIRRLGKVGSVIYDRSTAVLVSARRFTIENSFIFSLKCIFWAALRLTRYRISIFRYKWRGYPLALAEHDKEFLRTYCAEVIGNERI